VEGVLLGAGVVAVLVGLGALVEAIWPRTERLGPKSVTPPISGETGSLTPGDISGRGMGQRAYARPQSPALIDHGPMTVGPRRAFITEPQLGLCSRFPWTGHLPTVGSKKLVH
jgi:hypothetical protein